MALGENILKFRKKNGLSQEELGEKVNVTRQTISNWELEETTPNSDQLKSLSKALNVSIDELLDNEIENVVVKRLQITEKEQKSLKKIVKGLIIGFIGFLIVDIIAFLVCYFGHFGPFEQTKKEINRPYVIQETI